MVAMRNCCSVLRFIAVLFCGLEFSMDDIVDRVMNCYGIEPVSKYSKPRRS